MSALDRSAELVQDCEVAVIGAGPSGLTTANLLAHAGVRTFLIERKATTGQEPRAVSIDDEALRTLQAAGVVEEVVKDVALDYGATFIGVGGRRLYEMQPSTREYGYPRRSAVVQPLLEQSLRDCFEKRASATTFFGWELAELEDTGDGVELRLVGPDDATKRIRARYVVGADGAHSRVREVVGARLEGSTYEQRWLIVDLVGTKDRYRQSVGFSDGRRSRVNLPGPDGRRRLEFMLHPDEDEKAVTDERFVRELLGRCGPDRDATIIRKQVYTFHALVADRWQAGNLFLVGDAAHQSPPFAGQGMNSGIRDAHNIAWKLAAVMRGELGPKLLDTYQEEREPHARALIDLAVKNGRLLMRTSPWRGYLSDLGTRISQAIPAVAEYHRQLKRKPKGAYGRGFVTPGRGDSSVGRLVSQPRLELLDRSVVMMDDLIGGGFALLSVGRDAQYAADALAGVQLALSSVEILAITPWNYNLEREVWTDRAGRDIDGLIANGQPETVRILLVRPDRYIALDQLWTGSPRPIVDAIAGLVESTQAQTLVRNARTGHQTGVAV